LEKRLWTFLDIFWESVHFFLKFRCFFKKKYTTWLSQKIFLKNDEIFNKNAQCAV
jgi:hypothetical protein